MGKTSYMRLHGSHNLRLRLLLSTLSSMPVLIEDIRADATWLGLRPHEVSFLCLLEKVCDDCVVEINETDVHIFTDHKAGPQSGKSPGYGISVVAETTYGCCISVDTAVSYGRADEEGDLEEKEKNELIPPEDIGEQIASMLLGEIKQGGVVDSTDQGLLFLLCALCPQDVSKVQVGKLLSYGIGTLTHIRDFLWVKFVFKPGTSTGTVILKCIGCGLKKLSRKLS